MEGDSRDLEQVKALFVEHIRALQNQIVQEIHQLDPQLKIQRDEWSRKDELGQEGGGGLTIALEGEHLEKGGVNTSVVYGAVDPQFAAKLESQNGQIWAAGISLILHPLNPHVPTVHANFRLIHTDQKWWFGGGADLTPFYPYEEDFSFFHQVWKDACQKYDCYQEMKEECDRYFVNHHRGQEMRGVGGIFFDNFNSGSLRKDFEMVVDLSKAFIPSYFPLFHKRKDEAFTEEDVDFQLHRRGRYVEFNLVHDRGTLFGLKTRGRIESILISLPPRCRFSYDYAPSEGSIHKKMMSYYFPKDHI